MTTSAPKTRPSQPAIAGTGNAAAEPRPPYGRNASASDAHAGPASRPSQGSIGRSGKPSDKREAILTAALELFVERGFFGTAVPEIADRAGVGAGTIYRYFESKEALVNAIYREQKLLFAHVVLDDFPASAPVRDQFRLLWMRMAQFAIENTSSFVFLELHHHARYLDNESRAVEQRMTALIEHVIVSAQARGELKAAAPRLLMGMVLGAFIGVIRSCVEIDQPLDQADWKMAEQCMWEAIRS